MIFEREEEDDDEKMKWYSYSYPYGIVIVTPIGKNCSMMQTCSDDWFKILQIYLKFKFCYNIYKRNEKYIQTSTNMPGIGLLVCE